MARDTGALLAVLIGRGAGSGRYAVRRPEASLGRGEDNDVVLGDPSVSERHARLRLSDGVWSVADLGSVNGTWVDGEPVQGELPLASGCSLRLGGIELVFAAHDRWEDSPRRSGPGRPDYVLEASLSSRPPAPVLIGAAILMLALAGYLLTRVV